MASPTVFVSALTFTITQRIIASTTYTSITASTIDDWSSVTQGGVCKLNKGSASEWFSFTGITIGSTTGGITAITFTGVTMGLNKNATTTTSTTSTNRKNHASGTTVGKLVYHSQQINQVFQKDKDNTVSGNTTFTGTNLFSSTTLATLNLQRVTTTQRNALTGVVEGSIVKNDTTGLVDVYLGGTWVELGVASAPSNATTSVAGISQKATTAETIAGTDIGSTGASLFVGPSLLQGELQGSGTAGETLAVDQFIYVKVSDGKLYKCDSNVSSVANSWNAIGIIITGGAANATVTYRKLTGGEYTYSSAHGFTLGATLYLSSTGGLTATRPAFNDANIVPYIIGTAISTTKIALKPQRIPRRIIHKTISATSTYTVTVGFPISHAHATMGYSGATAGTPLGGSSGFFDAIANTQINSGNAIDSYILFDIADGIASNYRAFAASVNGSNNLVMTMTTSGTPRSTCYVALIVHEAL